jgi:hypothetical protein
MLATDGVDIIFHSDYGCCTRTLEIPQEALILKRYFDVETEWDHPEKEIVGPIEVEIEFDKILGNDKPKTRAKAKKARF